MAKKIVVAGGGYAGCGAAASAARAGADVTLVEKTDTLTGQGQIAGGFARDEQFPAHEELKAMGARDIAEALESTIIHSTVTPERNEFLRDCRKGVEPVEKAVKELGVRIIYRGLASDVEMSGKEIRTVKLKDGSVLEADAVVDATGGAGPIAMCVKYGHGCVSCIMMCPQFGGRISIAARAGVEEYAALRADGKTPGRYSAAVILVRETLSAELLEKLREKGQVKVPIPEGLIDAMYQRLNEQGGKIWKREDVKEITLWNEGNVHVVAITYIKREELKQIPGLENALFFSPAVWWIGNAIRFMAITPQDNTLKVKGVENLFVAGEKIGHVLSITPCYTTGALAGHNAVRKAAGMELLELPRTTAIGELIAYSGELNRKDKLIYHVFRLGRLKEVGLYTTDIQRLHGRIEELGLTGILSKKLV